MVERVRITVGSGRVRVIGESRDDVAVEGAQSSDSGGEIQVRGGSGSVTVRVPTGTDVMVGSGSGNVAFTGPLGAVSVTTGSAGVEAEDVASIDARTASGKLTVDASRGSVRLRTKSARVRVGRADGAVHISNVSGKVEIREARDSVSIKTVSGSTDVVVTGTGEVGVETVSGKITVHVPEGTHPDVRLQTVSGKKRIKCTTGDAFVISGRSISGSITVTSE
jgi:DUF4097 and DUF4098 domain-containing protein YvlB